ncbi:MAG: ribonuclease R [Clostridia bacterium]
MEIKDRIMEIMKENPSDFFTAKKLADKLEMKSLTEQSLVASTLAEIEKEGDIIANKNGKYSLIETCGYFKGTLQGNQKGFAFFRPENPEAIDLFIPNRNLNGALHGDKVLAKLENTTDESDIGMVEKIISRGVTQVVGKFVQGNNCGFVEADDSRFFNDIYVPKGKTLNAKNGMKVVCKITSYPKFKKNPEGSITEVLGKIGDVGCDVLSIIRTHNIKDVFDDETMAEAKKIPQTVDKDKFAGRTDFRNECIVTIDGEDARDLDDAISIKKNADGTFQLGVHIADVSEYVTKGSALDKEALERGTSVYFVDRVVPILPKQLSNGNCSLNENVDRLTLSCVMTVGQDGQVLDGKVSEGIIKTTHRMTYNDVTKIIDGDSDTCAKYADIVDMVKTMHELALVLIDRRDREGAIDFDTPEAKIILDDKGNVAKIEQYERQISNQIIEEFMILANRVVAEQMYFLELPFIYRIHEKPKAERLENFTKFVNAIGINFKLPTNEVRSKNFADLLGKLEGNVLYLIVNKVLLRSMQKAKYSAICSEHFGLSADEYCHFTSPIRRYPDLFVHRMLKMMINGKFNEKNIELLSAKAPEIANQCSDRERQADEAERDADDLKKCEYMATKLGEEYDGVVSGVTSFGVFVELENTCEGLARLETLPLDTYEFMEQMFQVKGVNHSFKLGDKVKIQVASVDLTTRRVNFVILENYSE